MITTLMRMFSSTFAHEEVIRLGAEAQEESKKEYLKLSPKEKARVKRRNEVIFGGDYICPHCKKDILEKAEKILNSEQIIFPKNWSAENIAEFKLLLKKGFFDSLFRNM